MNKNDDLFEQHHQGKRLAGLIVLIAGAVLLCQPLGVMLPEWLLSWPMFLIALGFYIGAKHRFRQSGWIILVIIGGVFLLGRIMPQLPIQQFFWPVAIITAGLFMIFGKRKKKGEWGRRMMEKRNMYEACRTTEAYHDEDYIDSVAIFGGIKKNILSKNFKGGEVVCVFGGAELNLSQAEIKGSVVLEIVNVFGGTKLILPPNWEIKSDDMVAILGGIEDKRLLQQANTGNGTDVLIIRGTSIFGGIEIKSF
jgi:predicted membrane protein